MRQHRRPTTTQRGARRAGRSRPGLRDTPLGRVLPLPYPRRVPSLRDATVDSPAPVRAVANAVTQWIDKLGSVWVEGQIAQVNRRPGVNTVFMTLRDTVADISVTLTCARSLFDSMNPPLVEGASVVVHARPSFYANRGSFSLAAREIRMVGLGELLARLERRRQLPSATSWRTPDAAGPPSSSRSSMPPCRDRGPRPR